jgi:lysozyme
VCHTFLLNIQQKLEVSTTKNTNHFNPTAFYLLLHNICNAIYIVRFIIAIELMKKKKKLSLWERFLNQLFSLRGLYVLIVIALITLYPVYVSDGQRWTYIESFGIKLPLRYNIHGIDVSHHNNKIDWHRVKNSIEDKVDISFCFIKATEGEDLKDQDFGNNWREAKKTGLMRGAYHFYVPRANPVEQARRWRFCTCS